MRYHLLQKPIRRIDQSRIEWECICGLRIALPPTKVPAGTAITVADAHGDDAVECAACYAGVDERGEMAPPAGAAANEREQDTTFDADIGDALDSEAAVAEDAGEEEVLKEDAEEYPE
jgi:hypothetical protein